MKKFSAVCLLICMLMSVCMPTGFYVSQIDFSRIISQTDSDIFTKINSVRTQNAKAPFTVMASLQNAASIRCAELAAGSLAVHKRSDGSQWYCALDEAGFTYSVPDVCEKFAVSVGKIGDITNLLINDTATKAIILNSDFCHLGCGFSSGKKNSVELIFVRCKPTEIKLSGLEGVIQLYVGDEIDSANLTAELTCTHGKSYTPVYPSMASDYDKNKIGAQTIEINYKDVSCKENVYVNFSDVKIGSWYQAGVTYCFDNGLFSGTSNRTFSPSMATTRAMFVTVLGKIAGVDKNDYTNSSFSDVESGKWYAPYVEWASDIGLTNGTGNGKFSPDAPITRQELCLMLQKYIEINEIILPDSVSSVTFKDDKNISSWAYNAVYYCQKKGFVTGDNLGSFNPKNSATRAESSVIFRKFTEALNQKQ